MTTEERQITVSVMEGAYSSRDVGTGSNRQGALKHRWTMFHNSSEESWEKLSRFSLGVTGTSQGSETWNLSRFSLMSSIFSKKRTH